MRDPVLRLPVPVFDGAISLRAIAPQLAIFISAGGDEFEVLTIGYFVAIDGECGNVDGESFILVVPAKITVGAMKDVYKRQV